MHVFDHNEQLKIYKTAEEIIDAYYGIRLDMYNTRKTYLINKLNKELILLSNKARYIMEVLEGTVDLRRMKKDAIIHMLQEKGYDVIDEDTDYKYLVKLPMDSVSEENVEKINKDKNDKELELKILTATTIQMMWLNELADLEKEYGEYKKQRDKMMLEQAVKKTLKKKKNVILKK